jgi:hypothetical protein
MINKNDTPKVFISRVGASFSRLDKKFVAISEEGDDVYEGDGIWVVDNFFRVDCIACPTIRPNSAWKIFSKKESVAPFVQMNKPSLSIQFMIDNIDKIGAVHGSHIMIDISKLKQLV